MQKMARTIAEVSRQIFYFVLIFLCFHVFFIIIRHATPTIGPDEKLFPKELLNNEKLLNEYRTQIATDIFKIGQNRSFSASSDVEIRVVASDRGHSYLFQTIVFLLNQQQFYHYNLSICNVETQVFRDLKMFHLPIMTIGSGESKKTNLNFTLKKENEDYWNCLGLPTVARYVLLIEDDAIIIPTFSNLLKSLIRNLDAYKAIDYVKLYHPINLRKLPALVLTITLSIVIAYCSCFLCKQFPYVTAILLGIAIYYDITTFGHQFLAEIRWHLTGSSYISYPESCCTPAVLFRKSSALKMSNTFKMAFAFSGHAKDHILDESAFIGRQTDVNYVTHIGSFSSVRQRSVYLSDFRGFL